MSGAGGAAPGGDDDGYAESPFRAARKASLLQRIFPVAGDLAGYPSKARGDLIAALVYRLDALADLSDDLARDGVTLRVARMKTPVQDRLEDAGIAERIGRDHFHPTVRAATAAPG